MTGEQNMHKRTVGFDDNTGLLAVINDRALPCVDIWVEQYLRDTDSMEEYTRRDKKNYLVSCRCDS